MTFIVHGGNSTISQFDNSAIVRMGVMCREKTFARRDIDRVLFMDKAKLGGCGGMEKWE